MIETLESLKEKLADYEAGRISKTDSRGRDVTKSEIEHLRNLIKGMEPSAGQRKNPNAEGS